jgi:hypothetical protein
MTKISNQYSLTNVLTADVVNGRVGINNGSPTVALDVTGAGKFSSSVTATSGSALFKEGYIVQATTTGGGGSQPAYTYYTAAGSKRWASFLDVGSDKLHISNASNSELFTIQQNGNVGIGTTSPDSKLNIVGGRSTFYANSESFAINVKYNSAAARGYWIGSPASGIMSFSNADGTERLRITDAGNVGIGTSSPGEKLEVANSSGSAYFKLTADFGSTFIGMETFDDSLRILTAQSTPIQFYTNNSERMRITSGGSVAIGTTTTGYKLHVEATSANYAMLIKQAGGDASYQPLTIWHAADSGNRRFIDFAISAAGNNAGSINFNSSTGLTMYNTSSDYRLKSDIQDFNALDIIKNLKPKKYKMLNANNKSIGFIAHELQEFFPQAVSGEKDEERMQQVDYSQLTGLLTKAIQELSADLTSAKQEIELLKAK